MPRPLKQPVDPAAESVRLAQEADMWRALVRGETTVAGLNRADYPSRGHSLHRLVDRGYMRCIRIGAEGEAAARFLYRLTAKGRAKRRALMS